MGASYIYDISRLRVKPDLRYLGIVGNVERYFLMDVSVQSIFPIFRGQAVFLACLISVDGPSRLSRNVDKKLVKS